MTFGSNIAYKSAIRLDTSSEIRVVAPSSANPGMVDVQVFTAGGLSAVSEPADEYTYIPPPVVLYVTPNAGPLSGKGGIEITGYHFGGATAVDFELQAGTITSLFEIDPATDLWTMIATAPPAYMYGYAEVRVTTLGGTSSVTPVPPGSYSDIFFYTAAPSVSAVFPSSGLAGAQVTIAGAQLEGAEEVEFGGVPSPSFSYNGYSGEITAVSPAGVAGTAPVTVVTPGGTSTPTADDYFTYAPVPVVSGLTANSGVLEGGTTVSISGTNFSGATAVDFGGVAATNVTVVSSTQITATSPAGTGTVDVTVTTPDGTSPASPADQFSYLDLPLVTAIGPLTGPTAGGTSVTISGLNFIGATDVYFGGVDVPLSPSMINVGGTAITVTSPADVAGTVDVAVVDAPYTSQITPADRFTYGAGPMVAAVSPADGPAAGGTPVTISGVNFSGATDVYFGSVDISAAHFTVNAGGTQITVTNPAGTGTVDVTVVTPQGTSTTSSADQFAYAAAPVFTPVNITGISPAFGSAAGGTLVTITGSGLANATFLNIGSLATIISDTNFQIVAITPPGTPGTSIVSVTNNWESSIGPSFTYIGVPVVTGISPTQGPATGGTTVTISGTNLLGATVVDFGGIPATSFTVVPGFYLYPPFSPPIYIPTTITAVSPPGDVSIVDVQVVSGGGESLASPPDYFTYLPVPNILGVSTTKVASAGSAELTITGTGLGNATSVAIGGLQATILSDVDNQIVVSVPPSDSLETVDVTVTTAGGTSPTTPDDQVTYVGGAGCHRHECFVRLFLGRRTGDHLWYEPGRGHCRGFRPDPRHHRR